MTLRSTKHSANQYWIDILNQIKPNAISNNVATMGANDPSWNADVQSKILGTGIFPVVDAINVSIVTPTLAELKTYGAVLVYSDGGFADADTFGDNLAAYVDGGGGVVVAVFENVFESGLGGNWSSGGYNPMISDEFGGNNNVLGTVLVPSSPIMAGVTTFNGGLESYQGINGLTINTTVIAEWDNGKPLVVEKTGFNGKIVLLNFYPPSSDARPDLWVASTDGALLMANALKYVMG